MKIFKGILCVVILITVPLMAFAYYMEYKLSYHTTPLIPVDLEILEDILNSYDTNFKVYVEEFTEEKIPGKINNVTRYHIYNKNMPYSSKEIPSGYYDSYIRHVYYSEDKTATSSLFDGLMLESKLFLNNPHIKEIHDEIINISPKEKISVFIHLRLALVAYLYYEDFRNDGCYIDFTKDSQELYEACGIELSILISFDENNFPTEEEIDAFTKKLDNILNEKYVPIDYYKYISYSIYKLENFDDEPKLVAPFKRDKESFYINYIKTSNPQDN